MRCLRAASSRLPIDSSLVLSGLEVCLPSIICAIRWHRSIISGVLIELERFVRDSDWAYSAATDLRT